MGVGEGMFGFCCGVGRGFLVPLVPLRNTRRAVVVLGVGCFRVWRVICSKLSGRVGGGVLGE